MPCSTGGCCCAGLRCPPQGAERVIETVEHLAGLQAPFPPYYGLWSRLAGFRPADLAELITDRKVVRIALSRSASSGRPPPRSRPKPQYRRQ